MWEALSDESTGLSTSLAGLASAVILGSESNCLRFETPFVASYDSQGYSGRIRPRLRTEWFVSCQSQS
jgi:hypothetical protein